MGLFCGVAGALMGFLVGAMVFVFSLAAGAGGGAGPRETGLMLGMGAGALIIVPIMYGIMGLIGGCINAVVYNVVAGLSGGIEMDFGP
jgi:hypothetical protein